MKDLIIKSFGLDEKEVLNIYSYGSRVYGTHSESSDYDFIIVMDKDVKEFSLTSNDGNINVHLYSIDDFLTQCFQHKIAALECIFLPKELLLKNRLKISFSLDKEKLRSSISEKASHSWVKAKKKLEVEQDKNVYIAKKSLFHSFRIIDFGMQIAQHSKIVDYASCNSLWEEIKNDDSEEWDSYKDKYHELHNNKMSEFRNLAPKSKGFRK
jgi:predicted nucleotidyltransferase